MQVLLDRLLHLRKLENQFSQLDPYFDQYRYGRASALNKRLRDFRVFAHQIDYGGITGVIYGAAPSSHMDASTTIAFPIQHNT